MKSTPANIPLQTKETLSPSAAGPVVRKITNSTRDIALEAYGNLMTQPTPSAGDVLGFRRTIMLAVLIGRTLEASEAPAPISQPQDDRARDWTREQVLQLRIEVNCRIEHGASSGGHLEYVEAKLCEILRGPQCAKP